MDELDEMFRITNLLDDVDADELREQKNFPLRK